MPDRALAWDDIRIVKAIADAGGLTGAAAALGANHSTLFRRLGRIEAALGTRLFERHRSGYVQTRAGLEMAGLAERLEADIDGFARRLAGKEELPCGELKVATNDSFVMHLLTPLFAAFLAAHPEMTLELLVGNQALNLARRDADVAVRATDDPPDTLVGRRVATVAWGLYGRRDVSPADAGSLPWVALAEGLVGADDPRANPVPPGAGGGRVAYRIDSVLGLCEAVEAGIGVGYLPCFLGDSRPALVRLADPDPGLGAGLWLLTHADLRHAPRVRAFLDFAGKAIGRKRALIEGRQGREAGLEKVA